MKSCFLPFFAGTTANVVVKSHALSVFPCAFLGDANEEREEAGSSLRSE